MPRVYDPSGYRKHKRPEGWGSLCPEDLETEDAQALLDTGVNVGGSIFNVDGQFAYRAFQHVPGRWHGFPIPWSCLPNAARLALIKSGRLDDATLRKALRKLWGRSSR